MTVDLCMALNLTLTLKTFVRLVPLVFLINRHNTYDNSSKLCQVPLEVRVEILSQVHPHWAGGLTFGIQASAL